MEIIGQGGAYRYVVVMSDDEILRCAGYSHIHSAPDGILRVGTKIQIVEAWNFIQQLKVKEKQATDAASVLRALAEMITRALPTIVIPPEDPKEPS